MKLDTLILAFVCLAAVAWVLVIVAGMIAAWPFGIPGLLLVGIGGYIVYRVVSDRLRNAEDDYYEKNVDR